MADLSDVIALANVLLDTRHPAYSLGPEMADLMQVLGNLAEFRIDEQPDITAGETQTDQGLAISPTQAAMCGRDVARTVVFMRGISHVIRVLQKQVRNRPIRVLYAGCGPFALLAIPELAQHSARQVSFCLLDIHQDSINCARRIVSRLGLDQGVSDYVCADATKHQLAADSPPDIILSETMFHCLDAEPQVAIVRNLLGQIPGAIMIPQAVRIDAALVNRGREFRFQESDDTSAPQDPDRDRIHLGTVFELDAPRVLQWSGLGSACLPAGTVRLPAVLHRQYDPMLLTTVQVYQGAVLRNYDCSLTLPRLIKLTTPAHPHQVLQFCYRLGPQPRLTLLEP